MLSVRCLLVSFLCSGRALMKRSCPIRRHSVKINLGAALNGQPAPPTAPGAFPPPIMRGAIKNRNSSTSPARIRDAATSPPPSHNVCNTPSFPSLVMSAGNETPSLDSGRTQTSAPFARQRACRRAGHRRVVAMIVCFRQPSVKIRAPGDRVPLVDTTTRHGRRPFSGFGKSDGLSAATVPAPTRMASARRRQV